MITSNQIVGLVGAALGICNVLVKTALSNLLFLYLARLKRIIDQ